MVSGSSTVGVQRRAYLSPGRTFVVLRGAGNCVRLGGSVTKDFGQELLGASRGGGGKELLGGGLFEDLAIGHEDDPLGCAAGETHLVSDDNHRHAGLGKP